MTQLLPVIAGAVIVIAAARLAGHALAPKLVPCLSFGLGAIILSYAVFALMVVHGAHRFTVIGLLLIAIVAGAVRSPVLRIRRPPILIVAICAPFFLWYLVNALAPEVQSDPNVYHLQPAIDAYRYGGFSGVISFYDRLPHAIEMLFVPAWLMGGASAAKLVHFAFLIATLPVIVHLARRLGLPELSGHLAAAFYLCVPIVGVAGSAAFNDAALVYFTVASVALALESEAVFAGLMSGFCYAVKMTGIFAVPVTIAFFLARKQWKAAVVCGCAAALMCSPWLLRNLIETGNPMAPFLNRWFPNPYFYVLTEQSLSASLKNYGVPFWQRFTEVLAGARLQGIIGPVFMVAPVALLALRRRSGALLVGLALVFSVSWWLNAGARFLMPALPFLALAICSALPTRVAVGLLLLHAVTSWPMLVHAYTPKVLQLSRFPWQAALRLESEQRYLERTSGDYAYAKLVERNTPREARILDFVGIHRAFVDREFIGSWSTSLGIRSVEALEFARVQGRQQFTAVESRFPPAPICGLRLIRTESSPELWNIHSIGLFDKGQPVAHNGDWQLSSSVNPWELPFAFDRNFVSRWSTWRARERGMYVQVDMATSPTADRMVVLLPAYDRSADTRVEICKSGRWERVSSNSAEAPMLNLRPQAMQILKQAGITHIVTPAAYQGIGILGDKLINEASEWNVEVVDNLYAIYVVKLR